MSYSKIVKIILLSLVAGVITSGLSIFYSSCGGSFRGYDCRYVSDMIFRHGLPFAYYSTGGIAGIQEFSIVPFLFDIFVWSLFALMSISLIVKFRKIVIAAKSSIPE